MQKFTHSDHRLVLSARRVVQSNAFMWTITTLILMAAVLVGLETSVHVMAGYEYWIHWFDQFILFGFLLEAILKLFAHYPRPQRYFMDPWNIFDFLIVPMCQYE